MLKQAFGRGKELQEEVVPLSNILSSRLDDFFNSSDDKNIISHRQKRNTINSRLSATRINGIAGYSGTEEGAIGRNRVAGHSGIESEIESINADLSNVKFSVKE